MPATTEDKQSYVGIINAIWGVGVVPNNSVDNINDEVIDIMDDVLTSIRNCSVAMLGLDVVFTIFYSTNYSSWKDLLKHARDSVSKSGAEWIGTLISSSRYKTCVVSAAAASRSRVQLALLEASM